MTRFIVLDDFDALESVGDDGTSSMDTTPVKVEAKTPLEAVQKYADTRRFDGYDFEYGDDASLLVVNPKTLVVKRYDVAAPDVRYKITERKTSK